MMVFSGIVKAFGILKTTIVIALIAFLVHQPHSAPREDRYYTLTVHLEHAPFNSLALFDYTQERDILIPGNKAADFTWEFHIHDTIVQTLENMSLMVYRYDPISNSYKQIRFFSEDSDTPIVNIGVEDRINVIHASYLETSVFKEDLIVPETGASAYDADLICEDFLLSREHLNYDLSVRVQDPFFAWFMSFRGPDKSYEEHYNSYLSISGQYPDSRFLMTNLALNLQNFKSASDVRTIYTQLSDKHKNSDWAGHIERFLKQKFVNRSLPAIDQKAESIIPDPSNYTLVTFSASWCQPCIAEIPLLKSIYMDLGADLNLIQISIDKSDSKRKYMS